MQKLPLLVAATVIGLGSAHSALAQAPQGAVGKPGAKATVQAPAVVSAKGNFGAFAREAPGAEARSAKTSVGALATVASAQAVASITGGKMSALAAPAATASSAKSGLAALANGASATSRGSSTAAATAGLNLTANAAP